MVFDFDKELFSSKIYGLLHRETVKKSIRQNRAQNLDQGTKLSERMVQNWQRKVCVLLLGNTKQCDEVYTSMASEYGQPLNLHAANAEIDVPSLLLQTLRRVLEEAGDVSKPLLNNLQPSTNSYSYTGVIDQIRYYLLSIDAHQVLSQSADGYDSHARYFPGPQHLLT
jgi:hypothetical protein